MKKIFSFCFFLILVSCGAEPKAPVIQEKVVKEIPAQRINWIWEDEFSEEEKLKLTEWIQFTSDCAQEVLGRYPFDIYYHFHRRENQDHAVVFGHTARTDTYNGAHFYLDPTYSFQEILDDWIAPHEISHLALPILAKDNMWFYEGFATYMSRKVMIEMKTITELEADSTCRERLAFIKPAYNSNSTFVVVADSLKNQYRYSQLYWGGASYFCTIDLQLAKLNKQPLVDILKKFQQCCHVAVMTIDEVVEAFDKISETKLATNLLEDYRTKPAYLMLADY